MKETAQLKVLDRQAAFVDVGSEKMHVSIAGGPPEVFGTMTVDLHRLRDWLQQQQVRSVAMEATGVYWLPLYSILEEAGLEVLMVNGRQTRNLPGRKTDMQDCQWGATLHAHGLLRAGFVPPAQIRQLQDYLRLRGDHISAAAACIQHQQKALERMNLKLHDVISSLAGASGQRVVEAILAGERDPERLAQYCDRSILEKSASGSSNHCVAVGSRSICLRSGRPSRAGNTIKSNWRSATGRLNEPFVKSADLRLRMKSHLVLCANPGLTLPTSMECTN